MRAARAALALALCAGCAASPPSSGATIGVTSVNDSPAPMDGSAAPDAVALETAPWADAETEAAVARPTGPEAPPEDTIEAQLAAPAAAVPERVEVSTDDDDRGLDAWLLARIRAARAGQPERVRVPLVWRALGTGCHCPEFYLGHSADAHSGGAVNWVSPRWPASPPEYEDTGVLTWVEGRFTGARELVTARDQPGFFVGRAWIFEVLSVSPEPLRANDTAAVQVLRARPIRGAVRPAPGVRPRAR